MKNNWIYLNALKYETNVLIFFRKEFEKKKSDKVEISVCAKTFYKLYFNGKFVARGPAPSDPSAPYYDFFTIEDNAVKVCIAVEVYSLGAGTPMVTEQNKGESGLNMEIRAGGKVYISDETFKCNAAPDYFRADGGVELANRISKWSG